MTSWESVTPDDLVMTGMSFFPHSRLSLSLNWKPGPNGPMEGQVL